MYMGSFWETVMEKMAPEQVQQRHPRQFAALEDEGIDPTNATFAYDVLPNLGPGGAYSDEDEETMGPDDDEPDIGPTVTGDKGLMCYLADIDELYTWNGGGDLSDEGQWLLWNY